ncbi:MAG: NAD(P)/FAD-dependent oxidoreductase [Desulfobulbales bacterium]|nr:NAD(P)/FAD-dependent oxidoreductase [Desulfobulbales bacterium]
MPEYHTIIAGAGPAGLACAAALAHAGKRVLVLERHRRIGPKVCAGGITWSGINKRVPAELIERSFPGQEVFTGWQKTTISGAAPLISTINRETLGRWMLGAAVAAGVEVKTATAVRSFSGNRLRTDCGEFAFRFLVGADGSTSTVRRLLGIGTDRVGVGINCFVPGDFPAMEWHLNDKLFANGYAWVFPHRQAASIGAYCDRNSLPPARLRKNLHLWATKHGINLEHSKMTAAMINCDFRGWRFANCFLAGDAAGLASPLTGEGIYPAIVSGEEIARTILDPGYDSAAMRKLLARHRLHRGVVSLTGSSRPACRLVMEALVLALRSGLIPFTALEMAG